MPQIIGKENLPAADSPAVYVANHQSFLVSTSFLGSQKICTSQGCLKDKFLAPEAMNTDKRLVLCRTYSPYSI